MNRPAFYVILALAALIYIINLFVDIMDGDALQYAVMCWEMLLHKNFLQLQFLQHDYLDKPPLLFWLGSLSYAVFGVSNFAYKLPSFLFALLAVFSTYHLCRIYYRRRIAQTAAIILASIQAVFMITNDVRTDTLLMGSVVFAIWQIAEYLEYGRFLNLVLSGLGLGLAMLSKGPIGIMVPATAFLPQIILRRQWKAVFRIQNLLVTVIIALLILPFCIGLYQQYGISGLRFYFCTQSFGRITGESEWNNHPDTFFLLHTTAWAFMPWALFLFVGLVERWIDLCRRKFKLKTDEEVITLFGFTLVAISLMCSKYQLPHYIFVIYPLGAIIVAKCLYDMNAWGLAKRILTGIQLLVLSAFIPLAILLQYLLVGVDAVSIIVLILIFPFGIWSALRLNQLHQKHFSLISLADRTTAVYQLLLRNKSRARIGMSIVFHIFQRNLIPVSALMIVAFNLLLSLFYYPALLKYQPGDDFGRYVRKQHANNNFVMYKASCDLPTIYYAHQFECKEFEERQKFIETLNEKRKLLVITSEQGMEDLKASKINYRMIDERYSYHIATLNLQFLNPSTRNSFCKKMYLLEVSS